MLDDPSATTMVSTIISMAHALTLEIVAEPIESPEQAKILRLVRCDQMQGFLISKPLAFDEMTKFLSRPPGWRRADACGSRRLSDGQLAQPAQPKVGRLALLVIENREVTSAGRLPCRSIPMRKVAHKKTIRVAGEQLRSTPCTEWAIVARRRPEQEAQAIQGIERVLHI